MNFKNSYVNHKEAYKKNNLDIDTIINPKIESIDYHRHQRMYEYIKPLLESKLNGRWLTIGDGKFGQDSIRLKQLQSLISILPTDISPYLLSEAKEKNLIENYVEENAECLTFKDSSFDFAFCKEAFHHFPRPYIGIYEMLRVAKDAIVLIEPNDQLPYPTIGRILDKIKKFIKKILQKSIHHHDKWRFEESGNYVYSLSKRELEKIALGIGLTHIAVLEFNDYYDPVISNELITSKSFKIFNSKLKFYTFLNKIGFSKPTNIIGVIFKTIPEENLQKELKEIGFEVITLPINPYI